MRPISRPASTSSPISRKSRTASIASTTSWRPWPSSRISTSVPSWKGWNPKLRRCWRCIWRTPHRTLLWLSASTPTWRAWGTCRCDLVPLDDNEDVWIGWKKEDHFIPARLATYSSRAPRGWSASTDGSLSANSRSIFCSTLKRRCGCIRNCRVLSFRKGRFSFWPWRGSFLAAWRRIEFRVTTCRCRWDCGRLWRRFRGPCRWECRRRCRLCHFSCSAGWNRSLWASAVGCGLWGCSKPWCLDVLCLNREDTSVLQQWLGETVWLRLRAGGVMVLRADSCRVNLRPRTRGSDRVRFGFQWPRWVSRWWDATTQRGCLSIFPNFWPCWARPPASSRRS